MKILIFEFITGGGLAQEELPESLAREGKMMLVTLIKELAPLSSVQLTVLLDWRFKDIDLPENIQTIDISSDQSVFDVLPALIEQSDLVWPIAPEIEFKLKNISALVEQKSKQLLNSSGLAVEICSDKLKTCQILKNKEISVIETIQLDEFVPPYFGKWVIKPKDGAGCLNNYVVTSKHEFKQLVDLIEHKSDYVIQPYTMGESLSLSCLFKEGQAWLLCCNRQQVSIKQGKFELNACLVNSPIENQQIYQSLIDQVAIEISGLWGYVGIDIIQPEQNQPLILEINPRLTTSYVGIYQALGVNVAKIVIDMVDKNPVIIKTNNNLVKVTI